MTIVELRRLWFAMRRHPKRFPITQDYELMHRLVLVVQDIEDRLERYSLAVPGRQPASSISDGLLIAYCWLQASVMHMQTMAEREAELTKKANRERL